MLGQLRSFLHFSKVAVLSKFGSCSCICSQDIANLTPSQSALGQMQAEMPWTAHVLALAADKQCFSLRIAPSHHTG